MRNKFISITLFGLPALAMTTAALATGPDFKPALITKITERVFTPHGFDDNDNVQVVLDGELKNTCYKAGPVRAKVDAATNTIWIHDHNYYYEGSWCAEVVTPYVRPVELGILEQGRYKVVVENDEGLTIQKGEMKVTASSTLAPDDYLYAPVSEMSVKAGRDGNPQLTLRGTFANTCMKLKAVRPQYSPDNVIEVLPIAEMGTTNCQTMDVPFSETIPLTKVPTGRTLIHVRSLNGQSLNRVFEF